MCTTSIRGFQVEKGTLVLGSSLGARPAMGGYITLYSHNIWGRLASTWLVDDTRG